jgi:ketosteroid isomerase-like protein
LRLPDRCMVERLSPQRGILRPMSHEHVEALKDVYARWAAGDFRTTPDIFASEIEIVWAAEMPDLPAGGRGLSVLAISMRTFLAAWDDYRWEADRFIPAREDRVLVLFTARGRGKGSSAEVEARWAHLWTFSGAKATRIEGFVRQADGFEAAGLEE